MTTFWCFYTDDAYKKAADRLGRSCARWGIPFVADKGEDRGSWKLNCNQKPSLFLRAYDRLDGPVVCLDADCVIHKRPEHLLTPHPGVDAILWSAGRGRKYVSTGVGWWGRTATARAMIAAWADECASRSQKADPQLKTVCDRFISKGAVIEPILPAYLKPYWLRKGVRSEDVVISCNERMCEHKDGRYDRRRRRIDPLTPEHEL